MSNSNPCETHYGVDADGFCPVCLIQERDELRHALTAACNDLNDARRGLMKAQGIAEDKVDSYDWPEWSGPANTLRLASKLLGVSVGRSRATNPED